MWFLLISDACDELLDSFTRELATQVLVKRGLHRNMKGINRCLKLKYFFRSHKYSASLFNLFLLFDFKSWDSIPEVEHAVIAEPSSLSLTTSIGWESYSKLSDRDVASLRVPLASSIVLKEGVRVWVRATSTCLSLSGDKGLDLRELVLLL